MQYVGIDIIEITRIEGLIKRWGKTFLQRVFTPAELKLYSNASSLAARFAAKEAVLKALGSCDRCISWQEIEILTEVNGKPSLTLSGKAKLQADASAINNFDVSLSHSKEYAVAFVIGESI